MKKISCGTLIIRENNGKKELLMGHVTGQNFWDILKGCKETHEDYITAALRELREESGFICDPSDLKDLGLYPYVPKKDLYLFKYTGQEMFCHTKAFCESTFFHKELEKRMPEMDDFKYVSFDEVFGHCIESFKPIFNKLVKDRIL